MSETYKLSQKEFLAVSALEGADRYAHLLKRVADWELFWGLQNESGWVVGGDDKNNKLFPIWPHPDYAVACATGPWSGNTPTSIGLQQFLDHWLPGMASDGILVAVFPTPTMQGVAVGPEAFREDLSLEMAKYE